MKMAYKKPEFEVIPVQGHLVMSDTSTNLTIQEGTPNPETPGGMRPW